MPVENLMQFARDRELRIKSTSDIVEEAAANVANRYNYNVEEIKQNYDILLDETEKEAYRVYLESQQQFGSRVFHALADHLIETGELTTINELGDVLADHFLTLDRFFLSLSQSRRSRAGSTFETIHNSLFKILSYPFDEQPVINGRPDFVMPSAEHFRQMPTDCIIFTSKRTLRERWRQVVTEGTRGLVYFLATIDDSVSQQGLAEMLDNRVYLVCPQRIKDEQYSEANNVLSFIQFFRDYLDPAMERWRRNEII